MCDYFFLRCLGFQDYIGVLENMRAFTLARTPETPDEVWLVEHPPVFTQGQAGKAEHILNPGEIPVIQTDRGGQVTYHGPGQLVVYFLLKLTRKNLTVRGLVTVIEQSVVALLADYGVTAVSRWDAPGVYVEGAKIASVGLRIKRGYSYHGLALNVDMDLEPFTRINPCGFKNMPITQLAHFVQKPCMGEIQEKLLSTLQKRLQYQNMVWRS